MLLYNVTVKIDHDIEQDWLDWMQSVHIPRVMATGLFYNHFIFKLLNEAEHDGITYSIQYYANSIDDVEQYLENYAPAYIDEHMHKFRHKHVAFRTLLESVD